MNRFKKFRLFVLLLILTPLCFMTSCQKETSSILIPDKKPDLSGFNHAIAEYYMLNDTTLSLLYETCDCILDSNLDTIIDKNTGRKNFKCNLSKDTLYIEVMNLKINVGSIPTTFSMTVKYQRLTGEELYGYWEKDTHYIQTNPAVDEKDSQFISYFNFQSQGKIFDLLEFTELKMHMFNDSSKHLPTFSEKFLFDWKIIYEPYHDISVTASGDSKIVLFGKKSNDSVYIESLMSRDIVYKSNNSKFGPDTFFISIPKCPNPYTPYWYKYKFLTSNILH